MSKKNKATASSMSLDELKTTAANLEGQLFKLQMQKATGQLANTALIRLTRKELARVKTAQGQKQQASALAGK